MKYYFILICLVVSSLTNYAQGPCDSLSFYGVEEDFTLYASPYVTSITVSGNWEGESILLVESDDNVANVYNNNPTNIQPFESLTICINTPNTVCCDIYVWNGQMWILYQDYALTYVPDDNFENFLENNNMGNGIIGDDYVFTSNISETEELFINNLDISDLTGIEDFASLMSLNCNFNPNLLHLDLSDNTELISVSSNQIWGTEMGNLSTLDISNSPNLESLTCIHSQVVSIDVSNSPNLIDLNISHNAIETIDLNNNIYLETLIVDNNLISEIDVTNNSNLNTLDISDNPYLECADIRNGNNSEISGFYSTGNPNLYCINVDDNTYSTNNWANILPQHYFSNNCNDDCYNLEMNCENLDIMITSSSESTISMTSNTETCMDPALGPFTYLWSGFTTSGEFIVMSSTETLNTYLDENIYLSDSVVICFTVTSVNGDACEVCKTLFYNGPIYEWISIDNPDQAVDLDCELIEIEIAFQNDDYIEMTSNAFEIDGVLTYTWATNGEYGNTFYFDENMLYDTIVSCMTVIDQYNESCEVCETLILTDNGWVVESENTVDPNDALFNICDSLNVFSSISSENSVTLSTNLDSLLSGVEIYFSWESWGNYLNVDIVENQNAFFDIPNNVDSFYFLLQVVISNNEVESSEVLCIYPFLIQWDSLNYIWQANSLTLSQMPSATAIDAYSNPVERKVIKIIDVLGRENQGDKNMVLFYIYDDGKIEKKFIINE